MNREEKRVEASGDGIDADTLNTWQQQFRAIKRTAVSSVRSSVSAIRTVRSCGASVFVFTHTERLYAGGTPLFSLVNTLILIRPAACRRVRLGFERAVRL